MSTTMTVTNGAALGTSPPAATLQAISDDRVGLVNLGTGTSPTTGVVCTINFSGNYTSGVDGPAVVRPFICTIGAAAAAMGIYVSSVTGRTLVLSCTVAPSASQAVGTIQVQYELR